MERKYPHICEPLEVGGVVYKNRIICPPMSHPNITAEGHLTPEMAAHYEFRAQGGAAEIAVSEAIVDIKTGKSHNRMIDMQSEYVEMGLAKTAKAIKRHGAIASMELSHGGFEEGIDAYRKAQFSGSQKFGPSELFLPDGRHIYEMPKDVIQSIIESYGKAAELCKRTGFDVMLVHGGHGWLINQFLSPMFNHRTDEYGGSQENRARFAIEVCESIRGAVGKDTPIEFRLSADEYSPEGYSFADTLKFVKMLEPYIDIFHVSTGSPTRNFRNTHVSMFEQRGCNVHYAAEIKKIVKKPVACVGGIIDPQMMEEILKSGKADLVGVGRGLIADPEIPKKIMEGREDEIVKCIRCFSCLAERSTTKTRTCTVNPIVGSEMNQWRITKTDKPKKVLVVGGGPGGIQAAITAAKRGHDVTLCEKDLELGGALKAEKNIYFKKDVYDYVRSKSIELMDSGAKVRINTHVTPEYVENENPDVLIVAIGSEEKKVDIEGAQFLTGLEDATNNQDKLADQVVILGGGQSGCEMSVQLADSGKDVTVIQRSAETCKGASRLQRGILMSEMRAKGVKLMLETKVVKLTENAVVCEDKDGKQFEVPAGSMINAFGRTPLRKEAFAFKDSAPQVVYIGDCMKVETIKAAAYRGFFAALDI